MHDRTGRLGDHGVSHRFEAAVKPATRIDQGGSRRGHSRANGGRVCGEASCETVLSIYNSSTFCWVHETPAPFRGTNVLRSGGKQ